MAICRDACDRCHVMKTRCKRLQASPICQRCDRSGVSCNYSPPGRTGRPQGSRKSKKRLNNYTEPESAECHSGLSEPIVVNEDCGFVSTKFDVGINDWAESILPDQHAPWLQELSNLFLSETSTDEAPMLNPQPEWQQNLSSQLNIVDFSAGIPTFQPPPAQASRVSLKPRTVAPLDHDKQLHQLLDLQNKLAALAKSFRDGIEHKSQLHCPSQRHCPPSEMTAFNPGSSLSDDVEETYRTTEIFVDMLTEIWPEQHYSAPQPHGSTVLLLLSSYFSFIQVFELLINTIRERLQDQCKQHTIDTQNDPFSCSSSSPAYSFQDERVPGISIGQFQLAMPQKALLQIHLQLIIQMMQRLKSMMQVCAERIGIKRSEGHGAVLAMAEATLWELGVKEESILRGLRATSSVSEDWSQ